MIYVPGRCCRVGQLNPTQFRVLWVANEPQDQAPRNANKMRMTEAAALTKLEPKRLKRRGKDADKNLQIELHESMDQIQIEHLPLING
jgi:hypothetical protein